MSIKPTNILPKYNSNKATSLCMYLINESWIENRAIADNIKIIPFELF